MILSSKISSSPKQQLRGALPYIVACVLYLWIHSSLGPKLWGQVGQLVPTQQSYRTSTKISVLTAIPQESDAAVLKNIRKLQTMVSSGSASPWQVIAVSPSTQKSFILKNGKDCHENTIPVYERFISRGMTDMALELWKYCKILLELKDHPTTAYIDFESPLLSTFVDIFNEKENYAVVGDDRYLSTSMIHGSLLVIQRDQIDVVKRMISSIVERDLNALISDPFFISRKLYNFIHDPTVISKWKLLIQRCHVDLRKKTDTEDDDESTYFKCPISHKYCCEIQAPVSREQPNHHKAVMMTTHFVLPQPLRPNYDRTPKPYALDRDAIQVVPSKELQDETPFIVTLRDDASSKRGGVKMKNSLSAYHQLSDKKCLSSFKLCKKCLKKMNSCTTCRKFCGCFCDMVCSVDVPKTRDGAVAKITPPPHKRDPNRLIPRMVHQTWFENIEKSRHPNKSRMVETWKKSGWEYKFYDDKDAEAFLSLHFPAEITEAFNAILPGAYKADLFRYCVLFIYGGVYADVDTILESSLDSAILSDTGFMIGLDSPGTKSGHRMCLWNGFMASAPGHPFLAKVIETVVNNIRNRFTSIDVMNTMCPGPLDFDTLLSYDLLFTTGPCILGASINRILGRPPQSAFEPGTLSFNTTMNVGKSHILNQQKQDMGAHRFTWLERNLIVLSTDHPNSGDKSDKSRPHYSKAKKDVTVFGEEKLYIDMNSVNEDFKFVF